MSKKAFLLLTIFAAILFGWPHLHNYPALSTGDHGRDLYAFEQVFKGKMVYKDFWWVYGPLMPYFYGLFYVILGVKISSVLIAKFILTIGSGVFFFLASSVVMPASWAFLAACFFLQVQQDFFFTFNHIGAIFFMMAVLWMILKYLYQRDLRFALLALVGCFFIGLVKINFGLSSLVATLLSITLIEILYAKNPKRFITKNNSLFFITGLVIIPLLLAIINWFLLKDLTLYEIRQCLPYFGDDQPYHRTPFETIPYYLTQHWLTFYHHGLNFLKMLGGFMSPSGNLSDPLVFIIFSLLVIFSFLTNPVMHGSTLAAFILAFKNNFKEKKEFWIIQFVIWSFFVLNFHEFIVSGVWYRTFWSQPFLTFFSFFMIATAMRYAPQWLRYLVASIWLGFFAILTFVAFASTPNTETSNKFLNMPRGQVYVGNEDEWVNTVNTVTAFLNSNLKKDELFFALPYDCIYYYLTGKESPTRQLIFFDHIKIPQQQEISVIKELEAKHVNYILMSNRMMASETGLGIFGKSYCPILYQYMMQNFTPIYRYGGNWQSEPGWAFNHGVIIFKRK